jgi:predicted transcriptional regulator
MKMATTTPVLEKHYTVAEVADMWGLSHTAVREMFRYRQGVLKLQRPHLNKRRREYVTLRIPESILVAVHNERSRGIIHELKRGRRAG